MKDVNKFVEKKKFGRVCAGKSDMSKTAFYSSKPHSLDKLGIQSLSSNWRMFSMTQ